MVYCAHESRGKSRENAIWTNLVAFPIIWSEPFVLDFFCELEGPRGKDGYLMKNGLISKKTFEKLAHLILITNI